MSRKIDVSDPENLSPRDRLHLQDYGLLPEGAEPVSAEERAEIEGQPLETPDRMSAEELEALEYSDWPKLELQEEATRRGLNSTGSVKQLSKRLTEYDSKPEPVPAEEG